MALASRSTGPVAVRSELFRGGGLGREADLLLLPVPLGVGVEDVLASAAVIVPFVFFWRSRFLRAAVRRAASRSPTEKPEVSISMMNRYPHLFGPSVRSDVLMSIE